MAYLRNLEDDELLRAAHIEFDSLTGTDLEAELLRRFEEAVVADADTRPLLKVLDDHGIYSPTELDKTLGVLEKHDADLVGALLDVLGDFDIDDPATLEEALELLNVLRDFDLDDPATLKKVLERNEKFEGPPPDLLDPTASVVGVRGEVSRSPTDEGKYRARTQS